MSKCIKFEGRPQHYQSEALGRYLHVEQVILKQFSWAVSTCATEMCLNVEHLEIHHPLKLDYPKFTCVYCGVPARSVDHLMPSTWTGFGHRASVLTVPACQQCNSAIGDSYAMSISDRRKIAQAYIAKRYRKVLSRPDFSEDELSEFEGNLRAAVLGGLEEKRIVQDRLNWPPLNYDARALESSGIDPYTCGLLTNDREEAL